MDLRRSEAIPSLETPGGNTTFTLIAPKVGTHDIGMVRQRQVPGGRNPLHTHSCEEVMVQCVGSVAVQVADITTTLRAGDVLIIPADTPHQIENTGSEDAEWLLVWPADVRFFAANGDEMQPAWAR